MLVNFPSLHVIHVVVLLTQNTGQLPDMVAADGSGAGDN